MTLHRSPCDGAGGTPAVPASARRVAGRVIKTTSSLCPECLGRVHATVSERAGEVWMDKRCPEHGEFEAVLSSDVRHYYETTVDLGTVATCCGGGCDVAAASSPTTGAAGWSNHSCTVLIEITERCNLSCPTCFAGSSPQHSRMMSLETYRQRLDGLVAGGKRGADMIQLSGGEPTIHPQLFEFIELAFARGFGKVTLNTNGIKLARQAYAKRLAACARSHPDCQLFVYLQFDGFDDDTHVRLRGRADLAAIKESALANCIANGIRVHPVMTLTRDINDHEVGDFLSLAIDNSSIRHVVIQPAMYSGRYENPRRTDRLTLADTVALVSKQSGLFSPDDFGPIPCSDPNCYSIAVAVRSKDGLVPVSRYFPQYRDWGGDGVRELVDAYADTLDGPGGFAAAIRWVTSSEGSSAALERLDDTELDRILDVLIDVQADGDKLWDRLLAVSIKPFMDAWTYDQDRIDRCCVHILDEDGNPVSFCEFNAVNRARAANAGGHDA